MAKFDLLQSLHYIIPELWLIFLAFAVLVAGLFTSPKAVVWHEENGYQKMSLIVPRSSKVGLLSLISIIGLLICAALVLYPPLSEVYAFDGRLVFNGFTRFMKVLVLVGAAISLVLVHQWQKENEQLNQFEYPTLIILASLGMMIMISANDMMTMYMGLELQSLSLYILAAFDRDNEKSSEAGIKYFVLGGLSSCLLLYGLSLLYGFAGGTGYDDLQLAITQASSGDLRFVFALVFILAGFSFKISAVPFHMWTPDVYQGAPTPVTAFFAAAPKVAAFAMIINFLSEPFSGAYHSVQQIIIFISIASMLLGAVGAIGQNDIKRLLAYSSIGHMGYALIGIASGSEIGIKSVLIYITIYMVMTIGAFAAILSLKDKKGNYLEKVDDLSGLSQTSPLMAFVIAMLMFSLAGIPPLAGFFAKFYVFDAAINEGLFVLAVIGVIASVIGCFYYLRVIKVMYFDNQTHDRITVLKLPSMITIISGFLVIVFFIYPSILIKPAAVASSYFEMHNNHEVNKDGEH